MRANIIAAKAGVSPSRISRTEKGELGLSDEILEAYISELKMTPAQVLASITPETPFPLREEVMKFITGPIWDDEIIGPPASGEENGSTELQTEQLEDAVEIHRLRELLTRFVNNGVKPERKLQLVLQSDSYYNEKMFSALAEAIRGNCPVLYASPSEALRRLAGSHLELKLRLALTAHQYGVLADKKSNPERALFISRSFPRDFRPEAPLSKEPLNNSLFDARTGILVSVAAATGRN